MSDPIERNPWPPPCVHGDGTGLCPDCFEAYEEDPGAYIEFGDHPEGLANQKRLSDEIAAEIAANTLCPQTIVPGDMGIPF